MEDTTEGVVIVDVLEDLTAAGLQEHPSKHVGLRNQDTVAGRLQEKPDERAFGVDVGVKGTPKFKCLWSKGQLAYHQVAYTSI